MKISLESLKISSNYGDEVREEIDEIEPYEVEIMPSDIITMKEIKAQVLIHKVAVEMTKRLETDLSVRPMISGETYSIYSVMFNELSRSGFINSDEKEKLEQMSHKQQRIVQNSIIEKVCSSFRDKGFHTYTIISSPVNFVISAEPIKKDSEEN